jgi:hypothetical protein
MRFLKKPWSACVVRCASMTGTLSQQSDIVSHVISICHRQRLNTSLMRDLLTGPTLYVAVFCFISSLLLLLKRSAKSKPSPRSVAILVLGDVGRSPRMMYHAESFAKLQFETFLVGYQGNVSPAAVAFLRTPRLVSPHLSHWSVCCLQALNRYLHCSLSHMSTFCIFHKHHLLSGNSHS